MEEVVRVVEGLTEEDQALVLAFAKVLREREALRLPNSEPRDESEWVPGSDGYKCEELK